jgi:hypothetical protein
VGCVRLAFTCPTRMRTTTYEQAGDRGMNLFEVIGNLFLGLAVIENIADLVTHGRIDLDAYLTMIIALLMIICGRLYKEPAEKAKRVEPRL